MSDLECFNCGAPLTTVMLPFGRRTDCPECRAELHCCRMCRHYDPTVPDECREDRAEPPIRKDVANFCEWFSPAPGRAAGAAPSHEDAVRARLDALFGEDSGAGGPDPGGEEEGSAFPDEEDPETAARRRLDDLFE